MTPNELDADEHAAFVAAVAGCFREHAGPDAARALLDDPRGEDPSLRDLTVRELGLPGLVVGEELGGAGVGLGLLADVFFEAGRQLVGGSLLPTALATVVVERISGDEGSAELLSRIADGTLTATVALHDREDDPMRVVGRAANADRSTPATSTPRPTGPTPTSNDQHSPAIRLSGTRTVVLDGLHADRLIVPVTTDDGWTVAVVDGAAPGVDRRALPSMDLTRRIAEVVLDDAPAVPLTDDAISDETWQRALDAATVLVAADAIGAAAEALDRAVAYARERHQFGRPIGSFQAIKHRLAQTHVDVESARAAIEHAAARVNGPDGVEACALAGLHASRVAPAATGTAIQVHGGVGFTWEHDAHLFHRRALAAGALLSPTAELERRLVDASCAA